MSTSPKEYYKIYNTINYILNKFCYFQPFEDSNLLAYAVIFTRCTFSFYGVF